MEKDYRYYKNSEGKIVRLYIQNDECPLNPRTDFDGHVGKMMCWHRYYNLGDYVFQTRKEALDKIHAAEKNKVEVSDETYYEEYWGEGLWVI